MLIKDSHTHTLHSYDGKASPETMITAAIAAGVDYIALTDHEDLYLAYCPRFFERAKDGFGRMDRELHFAEIVPLREKYADRITVAIGVEFGYAEEAERDYEDIARLPLDVIINSVHGAGHKDIYYPEFYDNRGKREAYMEYLEEVLKSVRAPYDWDVLGHLGYIERKSPYKKGDVRLRYVDFCEHIDAILSELVKRGKALEINTQTKGTGYPFTPDIGILKRYRELGGELITFGSDAHTPDRIGEKYKDALSAAQEAGFRYLTTYLERKPTQHEIL